MPSFASAQRQAFFINRACRRSSEQASPQRRWSHERRRRRRFRHRRSGRSQRRRAMQCEARDACPCVQFVSSVRAVRVHLRSAWRLACVAFHVRGCSDRDRVLYPGHRRAVHRPPPGCASATAGLCIGRFPLHAFHRLGLACLLCRCSGAWPTHSRGNGARATRAPLRTFRLYLLRDVECKRAMGHSVLRGVPVRGAHLGDPPFLA
jgi:hypothetical protein